MIFLNTITPQDTDKINAIWANLSPIDRVTSLSKIDNGDAVFSTSFGQEDQYLTYLSVHYAPNINIFTLDTGRLFEQTYTLWHRTENHYNIQIKTYMPKAVDINDYKKKYGLNGFYETIEARKQCCQIRKVTPLLEALAGKKIWISGLRRMQSENRQHLPFAEYDVSHDILKLYPLVDCDDAFLQNQIHINNIPVNPLHDQGYVSIGCSPCTRAIKPNEAVRAGRWWWEDDSQECGLHFSNGKIIRQKDISA